MAEPVNVDLILQNIASSLDFQAFVNEQGEKILNVFRFFYGFANPGWFSEIDRNPIEKDRFFRLLKTQVPLDAFERQYLKMINTNYEEVQKLQDFWPTYRARYRGQQMTDAQRLTDMRKILSQYATPDEWLRAEKAKATAKTMYPEYQTIVNEMGRMSGGQTMDVAYTPEAMTYNPSVNKAVLAPTRITINPPAPAISEAVVGGQPVSIPSGETFRINAMDIPPLIRAIPAIRDALKTEGGSAPLSKLVGVVSQSRFPAEFASLQQEALKFFRDYGR